MPWTLQNMNHRENLKYQLSSYSCYVTIADDRVLKNASQINANHARLKKIDQSKNNCI